MYMTKVSMHEMASTFDSSKKSDGKRLLLPHILSFCHHIKAG
jgi:hypothetical protein